MFQDKKEIVSKLKTNDKHFRKVFDEHNSLEDKINELERDGVEHIEHFELEKMKKERLTLKDELYKIVSEAE